ncbi:MAG TPA: DegT/DnrJ/EryC1/StrS family aminotransferase, partial [Candidatus Parcubacteria bacterium]|nr:DegT/DnrJ/EryC1/StrS family aminotransferase [Candidatus Parcubacteria bacterium]
MPYKVPFVNYPLQYKNLKGEIDAAIQSVLERGDLILRRDVEDFEKAVAEFVGTKYAVGLNSGTDALFFSLKAAGIGPGDEVVTVSHTFIASISTIVHTGAKPILIDVKEDFLMDVAAIEKAITSKTKAILPVHLNGRVCEMDKIMEIAEKHNLVVIEDAAQALGTKFKGKGGGSFGLTGCFSFYPAKILGSYGDAGALTTNNPEIAEKIRLYRDHCQETKTKIVCHGWNSRLDNIQAAVLNVKIRHLPRWIERRREIAKIYENGLSDISDIKLPPGPGSDEDHFDNFQNYVLRVQERDSLFN